LECYKLVYDLVTHSGPLEALLHAYTISAAAAGT